MLSCSFGVQYWNKAATVVELGTECFHLLFSSLIQQHYSTDHSLPKKRDKCYTKKTRTIKILAGNVKVK